MKEFSKATVGVNKKLHTRLKRIALKENKKIYEVVEELLELAIEYKKRNKK